MQATYEIVSGMRFGQLTVIRGCGPKKTRHKRSLCQCDCGSIFTARNALLRDGTTTRCRKCGYLSMVETRENQQSQSVEDGFALAVYRLAARGLLRGVSEMREIMELAHERIRSLNEQHSLA